MFVQSITQILINRYQIGRLYRLVALGKASRLDVTGESQPHWMSEPGWTPSALFLFPFLVVTQLLQLTVAALLGSDLRACARPQWHGVLACALFALLGTGNLLSTLDSYRRKLSSDSTPVASNMKDKKS